MAVREKKVNEKRAKEEERVRTMKCISRSVEWRCCSLDVDGRERERTGSCSSRRRSKQPREGCDRRKEAGRRESRKSGSSKETMGEGEKRERAGTKAAKGRESYHQKNARRFLNFRLTCTCFRPPPSSCPSCSSPASRTPCLPSSQRPTTPNQALPSLSSAVPCFPPTRGTALPDR